MMPRKEKYPAMCDASKLSSCLEMNRGLFELYLDEKYRLNLKMESIGS